MDLRTIMIFPAFENVAVLDQIREKYDPLAKRIRPHITLVFPFEDEMSNEKLSNILDGRLAGIKPFHLELHGFRKCEDRFGNYLFLDVVKGKDEIIRIHDLLYRNEFRKFDMGFAYSPHITVGKRKDRFELERAYEEIKDMDCSFVSEVRKISVERIGEQEESIIVLEKKLG